jgi:hypothetical protein
MGADRGTAFDQRMREWLTGEGVGLCEYATMDDFAAALSTKTMQP